MTLPLYFRFSHTVHKSSFRAAVTASGRCLRYQDDDGWWITGVECGGITADDADPIGANRAFSLAFRETLDMLATESESLTSFRDAVTKFFQDINEGAQEDWLLSRRSVQTVSLPDLSPVANLPKVTDELPLTVQVEPVQTTAPIENDVMKVAA